MNRRAKGNRNENRSAVFLEKQGYYCMTSRASATAFDVSATYMGTNPDINVLQRLVQVKTNGGYTKSEIENLRLYAQRFLCNRANVRIELHDWKKNKREPIILVIGEEEKEDYYL